MVNRSYLLVFEVVLFKERHFCLSSTCTNFPNSVSVSKEDDLKTIQSIALHGQFLWKPSSYNKIKVFTNYMLINFFHTDSYLAVFFLLNIQEQRKYFSRIRFNILSISATSLLNDDPAWATAFTKFNRLILQTMYLVFLLEYRGIKNILR